MNSIIATYSAKLREEMKLLSEEAMIYPKADPFEHGQIVGRYQGMREAFQLMTAVLEDSNGED